MVFNRKAITELREANSLSLTEFAASVGANKQQVATWEAGISEPRISSLVKIANTYDVPIDQFFLPENETIILPSHEK